MTNVVQFPNRRLPPMPDVDALLAEVTAVEIELARARIAQINLETRQASALWGWWCLKRAVVWGLVLWMLVTCAKAVDLVNTDEMKLPPGEWCLDIAIKNGRDIKTGKSIPATMIYRRGSDCPVADRVTVHSAQPNIPLPRSRP